MLQLFQLSSSKIKLVFRSSYFEEAIYIYLCFCLSPTKLWWQIWMIFYTALLSQNITMNNFEKNYIRFEGIITEKKPRLSQLTVKQHGLQPPWEINQSRAVLERATKLDYSGTEHWEVRRYQINSPNSGMRQVLGSSVQEAASATLKHAAHLTKSVTRKESCAINHFIWKGCQRELTITPYRWLLPRINRVQERTKLATNGKTIWRIRGT